MKKALLILAAMAMSATAFAQGTIFFNNRGLTDANGNTYNALVFRPDGTTQAGDGFTAGLFLASDRNNPNATPLATSVFRTSAQVNPGGIANPVDVAIPGTPVQGIATLLVRAWETSAGSYANSTIRGQSLDFTTSPLGGPNPISGQPPFTSPGMGPNFQGFTMVPEPTTIALGALGIGALLLRRRK
jgi:hypothetical protein